ncbi:MAG: nucleotidyltransferase domain-containing protein [Candidatus Omnitrophica bacterium]|nr:nucleotidyltransferase domain-containing protein [Candidatus Omnitrophota bacterium]
MITLRPGLTVTLLRYFFINPSQELYVNEIAKKLALDKRNLVRVLNRLEAERILKSRFLGNLKLFSLNERYALVNEIRSIVLKSSGIGTKIKELARGIKGLHKLYIYGSCAKGTMGEYSDIDILAVGRHSMVELNRKLSVLQNETGREVNVINMDPDEFAKKKQMKDPFLAAVLGEKHIEVL